MNLFLWFLLFLTLPVISTALIVGLVILIQTLSGIGDCVTDRPRKRNKRKG